MPRAFCHRLDLILDDFSADNLNPKLWDGEHIRSDVLTLLLKIANDFAKEREIPKNDIDDIVLTGSMANFNWSEHSDIDLHLIIDPGEISSDVDLAREYFKLAKTLWNHDHNISICGHDVEIYLQAKDEPHYSTGVYSLLQKRWVRKPTDIETKRPTDAAISRRAKPILASINDLKETSGPAATRLKDKIKKLRKAGLVKGGEYSLENLTFKYLRNSGALDKLTTIELSAYDDAMSINHCTNR